MSSEALLGVENSLKGRRWVLRPAEERAIRAMMQGLGCDELIARALVIRQIAPDQAPLFLAPTIRAMLPDPSVLTDMDRAAERIAGAIRAGETIAIFGDYDVDGAASAALWLRYLRQLGAPTLLHIPDRIEEGYGPNGPALRSLQARGAGLVIAVDCGTTAGAALEEAEKAALDVIVFDHHAAEAALPPAYAIVNPNRLDDTSGHGVLAAVGVCFLGLVAVNRALRKAGWFGARAEPDLLGLLDLVALATICDVAPLTGLNRALVSQGLRIMNGSRRAGIAALAERAGVSGPIGVQQIGYALGPRINAGGRVGQADLGALLLATDDSLEAATIADRLEAHNSERRAIEATVLAEAIRAVEAQESPGPVIVVAGEGWHPGVIGIVAGRLKERYERPACVIAWDGAEGKASGRSVPGFDLGAAVIEARRAGLLAAAGGHRMAAGFTIERERLAAFRDYLAAACRDAPPPARLLSLDGVVSTGGATLEMADLLARIGPFGQGNEEPRFVLSGARISRAREVGQGHVQCFLAGEGGPPLGAIAFRALNGGASGAAPEGALGQALLTSNGAPLHLAGRLRVNHWQGERRAQMEIEDAAPAWATKA